MWGGRWKSQEQRARIKLSHPAFLRHLHYNQPLEHLEKSKGLEKGAGNYWPGVDNGSPSWCIGIGDGGGIGIGLGNRGLPPIETATGDLALAAAMASVTVPAPKGAGGGRPRKGGRCMGLREPVHQCWGAFGGSG